MNPSRNSLFVAVLALSAYGFTLTAASADSEPRQVQLISSQSEANAEPACPYPPNTPAAEGAEVLPQQFLAPSPLRPAVYREIRFGVESTAKAKIII